MNLSPKIVEKPLKWGENRFLYLYKNEKILYNVHGSLCLYAPNGSDHMPACWAITERIEGCAMETEKRGRLLIIEGLDGSGKATQARLLAETLAADGVPVRQVSFPNYASDSSALVKMYLAGEFGRDPNDVNAFAASSFFAVDRYASYRREWRDFYLSGGTVIADRYTTSNAVHQCSKLPREQWDSFLDWLFEYEYSLLGIPAPDAVIYLRVDPDISQKLMTGRYQGHEEKKDIHESNMDYLRRSRQAADYCCGKLNWRRVECARGGEMRSIEEIHKEIMDVIRSI